MTNPNPFRTYLQELQRNLSTGSATEHTYRPALKTLLETIGDRVQAINEPSRVECGAPDYIITHAGTPIGYVEAKDIGTSLDTAERSEQLGRYRASLNNLILTDYLEFRWYVEGKHRETARLATVTRDGKVKRSRDGVQAVADLLQKFFAQEVPTLGRPRELAERMAALARMTRNLIEETFRRETETRPLHAQLGAFRETLIPDLTPAQFADMYAQTIAYGLFAARCNAPTGKDFTWKTAFWNLPQTNPFLQKLFREIAVELPDTVAWIVDDLAHLLARADMAEILQDFGKRTRQEDPVVHFYETFLAAYDPRMRQRRGVYYTPEPVVSYIVRSLDHIVRARFDRPLGLADSDTLILDPAAGTATFLYFVIQQIHETVVGTVGQGGWSSYVAKKLLSRVFGFELLMAPYAVAHMKLGILLRETGYDFKGDQRLGIYLTNALEEAIKKPAEAQLVFANFIEKEAQAATEVKKEKPIMVVLGNPPYSVSSANKGDHIEHLMDRYKAAVRDERNIQPLSDDYIKFIRFAHDRIERTGYGVIGMITNHTYLSGLIHRGMREELMKSFSEIYVLNLHGSALLGETAPDGGKDENVFDIRQGVAIALFVKKPGHDGLARVQYADLWGLRDGKYRYLLENDVSTTDWQTLEPVASYFFFVPKELDLQEEFQKNWSVVEIFGTGNPKKDQGRCWGIGVKTNRDHLLVDFDRHVLEERIQILADTAMSDDDVKSRFGLRDSRYWNTSRERQKIRDVYWGQNVVPYFCRPFDTRWVLYQPNLIEIGRGGASKFVMRHMVRENIALLTMRRIRTEVYNHFLVTRSIVNKDAVSMKDNCVVFPLYLYTTPEDTAGTLFATEEVTREPNLSPQFIAAIKEKLGLEFVPDGKGDLQSTFGPEDIFHYAYAVFHSPTYRERYAEFLKIDFPRLPLTSDRALFKALAEKGEELMALHLMESPLLNQLITRFPVADSNEVGRVRYTEPRQDEDGNEVAGRVYINKTQYFEGIDPDVWEFQIGGYQVLHKWLKDRRGRSLSFDDLFHYQKIVVALKETMRLMEEVDGLIPSWPLE